MDLKWFDKVAFRKVMESVPLEEIIKDEYININHRTEKELKAAYDALILKREKSLEKPSFLSQVPKLDLDPETLAKIEGRLVGQLFPEMTKEQREARKKNDEMEKQKKRSDDIFNFKAEQSRYFEEKEILQKEVNFWNEKINDNKLLYKHIGKPRGIVAGIIFITIAIILGIGTPICFLPMQVGDLTESMRLMFLGGLFIILLYFIVYLSVLASTYDSEH